NRTAAALLFPAQTSLPSRPGGFHHCRRTSATIQAMPLGHCRLRVERKEEGAVGGGQLGRDSAPGSIVLLPAVRKPCNEQRGFLSSTKSRVKQKHEDSVRVWRRLNQSSVRGGGEAGVRRAVHFGRRLRLQRGDFLEHAGNARRGIVDLNAPRALPFASRRQVLHATLLPLKGSAI